MDIQRKLAEMFNVTPDIEYMGTKYTIKLATLKQRAQFATWVQQRAWEFIERLELTDEDGKRKQAVREMRIDLAAEAAAGMYEWGGDPVVKAVGTRAGQAQILFLLLRDTHPEVSEEMAKEMLDARYVDIAERVTKAVDDPKILSELMLSVATLKSLDG